MSSPKSTSRKLIASTIIGSLASQASAAQYSRLSLEEPEFVSGSDIGEMRWLDDNSPVCFDARKEKMFDRDYCSKGGGLKI